jgi:hypothetical protein
MKGSRQVTGLLAGLFIMVSPGSAEESRWAADVSRGASLYCIDAESLKEKSFTSTTSS